MRTPGLPKEPDNGEQPTETAGVFVSDNGRRGMLALVTASVSGAATPPCTAAAAQTAVPPPGMTVGPISTLNRELPTGVLMVPAKGGTPAYCLVTGSIVTNLGTGKTANFGLALLVAWNNKFLFSGCGGDCGVVFQSPPDDQRGGGYPPEALAEGDAIAATDDGHAGDPPDLVFDATWAVKAPGEPNDDALTDYYHRAVHVVTGTAKQFVQQWYSATLARSYFFGCSDGGREGRVEATRYPTDFNGYTVGDPFFGIPGQILAGRAARALLDAPDAYIPPDLLKAVDEAVYADCDAADGMKDNLIQNPGKCSFRPESLLCTGGKTADCLTQNQINTLNAWFAAAKNEQGRVASYGFPVSDIDNEQVLGNNLFVWAEAAGPLHDVDAADPLGSDPSRQPPGWAFYDQSFKSLVHLDPSYDNNNSAVDRRGVVNEAALAPLEARTGATIPGSWRRSSPRAASSSCSMGTATALSIPSGPPGFTRTGRSVSGGSETRMLA
jgi:feruloyl esterase